MCYLLGVMSYLFEVMSYMFLDFELSVRRLMSYACWSYELSVLELWVIYFEVTNDLLWSNSCGVVQPILRFPVWKFRVICLELWVIGLQLWVTCFSSSCNFLSSSSSAICAKYNSSWNKVHEKIIQTIKTSENNIKIIK